jgi:hypothetical protein
MSITRRLVSRSPNPTNTQEYLKARNTYFLAIKNAKRSYWNTFLENKDTKLIFKAASYTKSKQVKKLPSLKNSNGQVQESFKDKCSTLRQILFPTPPESTSPNWGRYTGYSWDWPKLSSIKLSNACSTKIKGKFPGPDAITQELIQYAYKAIPNYFFRLYSTLIDLGYYPKCWR